MTEQPFKAITRLRKSGNLKEAWDLGVQAVKDNPNDQYIKGAMFWVCYAYIKSAQSKIAVRAATQNDEHTPSLSEIKEVEFYARCIEKLGVEPDEYNYRSLLLICQRNLQCFPNLILLLLKHSKKQVFGGAFGKLFLNEDKVPFDNGKGESPSLMLKFTREVAKAWLTNEQVRQIPIEELCDIISRTRAEVKDKQHLIWLDKDEADCLILAENFEAARICVRAVLRKKSKESWALALMARTYVFEDKEAAIALYCNALINAHDEKFALPVLKEIAPLLASKGSNAEASMCVKRAVNCYVENGWNIKSDLENLIHEPWYDAETALTSLAPFLRENAKGAAEYVYGKKRELPAIVIGHFKSDNGFHAYISKSLMNVPIRINEFQSGSLPSIGDYIIVVLAAEEDTVIEVKRSGPVQIEGLKKIEGTLNIASGGFGFIENTFVPPNLIEPEMDGFPVRALTVWSFDALKKRHGRKAINIDICATP